MRAIEAAGVAERRVLRRKNSPKSENEPLRAMSETTHTKQSATRRQLLGDELIDGLSDNYAHKMQA